MLRLDDKNPAKKAMMHYNFHPSESPKFRGRPKIIQKFKLSEGIKLTVTTGPNFIIEYNIRELKINNDLKN